MKRSSFLFLSVVLSLPWAAVRAEPSVKVRTIGPIAVTVGDIGRSVDFYTNVLSFERISDVEVYGEQYERLMGVFGLRMRMVGLKLGDESLELVQYLAPRGRPMPADSRANDQWFQHVAIIVNDMDRAYEHLRRHKVEHASTGPQTLPDWNKNAGGIKAFYFRDPDGHFLEVLWFPPGRGDEKWHVNTDRLFLGIDHTAIVVRDTEASLRLYRDVLGMRVAGGAENYGSEQEHLNNVFGARLRITALRADTGPGVELLEYLSPRDGRSTPVDTKANDLWHWHVRLTPESALPAGAVLCDGARSVSPGVVELPKSTPGFGRGSMVRDPDGHGLLLAEP